MNTKHVTIIRSVFLFFSLFVLMTFIFHQAHAEDLNRNISWRTLSAEWVQVKQLIEQQKNSQALDETLILLKKAKESENVTLWTEALLMAAKLQNSLHDFETAVNFLKNEKWPQTEPGRTLIQLYYAQALDSYRSAYSWEISKREKVESSQAKDLKYWTQDELVSEARRAYRAAWDKRKELGDLPITTLQAFLKEDNYPPGIRNRLRDAMTYLLVQHLADTTAWTLAQNQDIYQIHLHDLLKGHVPKKLLIDDTKIHPFIILTHCLKDLENWNRESKRPEAELEARLVWIEKAHASLKHIQGNSTQGIDDSNTLAFIELLTSFLPRFRKYAWWSMGQYRLADLISQTNNPHRLAQARERLLEGEKAYPNQVGGQFCNARRQELERADFNFEALLTDNLKRNTILIRHKNLSKLYFRAYLINHDEEIKNEKADHWISSYYWEKKIKSLLNSNVTPTASWSVELPPTPDLELHRTHITPPLKTYGIYYLVASTDSEFRKTDSYQNSKIGQTSYGRIQFTPWVLTLQKGEKNKLSIQLWDGATGTPIAGEKIEIYTFQWGNVAKLDTTLKTSSEGMAEYNPIHWKFWKSFESNLYILARNSDHYTGTTHSLYRLNSHSKSDHFKFAVFHDRGIYRPGQTLFWKTLAFEGDSQKGGFKTSKQLSFHTQLIDPNGEVVATKEVTTNDFGTAIGEFVIPSSRPLGFWSIRVSIPSAPRADAKAPQQYPALARFRVEEYKRPTFEAEIKLPDKELKLNAKAIISGEAKYYFGSPLTQGHVRWVVTQRPQFPFGYFLGVNTINTQPRVVASGTTQVNEKGNFAFEFIPEADPKKEKTEPAVTYHYEIIAHVTDEGGETRSAARQIRLGFISKEALIDLDSDFLSENQENELKVRLNSLNGVAQRGIGRITIRSLEQPSKTLLPAELPRTDTILRTDLTPFQTPGDTQRSRWETDFHIEQLMSQWREESIVFTQHIEHDAQGIAPVQLPKLKAGAYRIHYETPDSSVERKVTSQRDFIVVGEKTPLALPYALFVQTHTVEVGQKARIWIHSGLPNQLLTVTILRTNRSPEMKTLLSGRDPELFEIPIEESDRGGFSIHLKALRDHQVFQQTQNIFVPWSNKQLTLDFSTFREVLTPGTKESWKITVKDAKGGPVEKNAAEVLAFMYDRSLDLFAPHSARDLLSFYPHPVHSIELLHSLHPVSFSTLYYHNPHFSPPSLFPAQLQFFGQYGIGGPGRRYNSRFMMDSESVMSKELALAPGSKSKTEHASLSGQTEPSQPQMATLSENTEQKNTSSSPAPDASATNPIRSHFAETAFWIPQLITNQNGSVTLDFQVPDSVTAWNVWASAMTKDLKSGMTSKKAQSIKELMVRPYLPRFLREGDHAEIKVVINNSSDQLLKGNLKFEILDESQKKNLNALFSLHPSLADNAFEVKANDSTHLNFKILTPKQLQTVHFRIFAQTPTFSDGELRPLPILPSRIHLVQSRFATLKNQSTKTLTFEDLKKNDDPTRMNEKLVVTVEAQLFYSVLQSLPYLLNYPYECTEQTLNRFLSTATVSSIFNHYPAVAKMAKTMATRSTVFEPWSKTDVNRKMTLEETPWLRESRGEEPLLQETIKVLDPKIAEANQKDALNKLRKIQHPDGGFPWFPGGRPSDYITLYVLVQFARAAEFQISFPKEIVSKAWHYIGERYRTEWKTCMSHGSCYEFLTLLNFAAGAYPDSSWLSGALNDTDRVEIADYSFKHWKEHSPLLKSLLALTLFRMKREPDAHLVFDSVMDSAKSNEEQGTFWSREDRSWLWYHDEIDTHAMALRALLEISPSNKKLDGLVQWLFLNKKLNQWKSTRSTAEVIYSLIVYLKKMKTFGTAESIQVVVGGKTKQFNFTPDQYTGKNNQIVIPGAALEPQTQSTILIEKKTPGFAFAAANWHYSTERLPDTSSGDFMSVNRMYFKRVLEGTQHVLKPLLDGENLNLGDQIEVQLAIKLKHAAEFIHLRDPRAAGLEPENATSSYRWDLGLGRYEEVRDSATNFFFDWIPVGEYTFKYRLRANTAGVFQVGPATLQSLYAPEFNAYSAGHHVKVFANSNLQQ